MPDVPSPVYEVVVPVDISRIVSVEVMLVLFNGNTLHLYQPFPIAVIVPVPEITVPFDKSNDVIPEDA